MSPQVPTADEIARIDAALAAALRRTRIQIIPCIAQASDRFEKITVRMAVVCAVLAVVLARAIAGGLTPEAGVVVLLVGAAVGVLLARRSHWPVLKLLEAERKIMGWSKQWQRVSAASEMILYDPRHRRADRPGLVLYVSLIERMAVACADPEVNEALGSHGLEEIGRGLRNATLRRQVAEGMVEAIEQAAAGLVATFPQAGDDAPQEPHVLVLGATWQEAG